MRVVPVLLLSACASAATKPSPSSPSATGDTAAPPTTDTTGSPPTRTSPTPTGDCSWLDAPGAPLGVEIRALDEGADYLPIPLGTTFETFSDAATLDAWSADHRFPIAADAVDFAVEWAVVATYRDNSSCGATLHGVDGWVGGDPRVEVRVEDAGHGCYSPCDGGGGVVVLVAVPSVIEPVVCVRVGGGCDSGF